MDYQDQERSAPNGLNPANPRILILTNYPNWVRMTRQSRWHGDDPGRNWNRLFEATTFVG